MRPLVDRCSECDRRIGFSWRRIWFHLTPEFIDHAARPTLYRYEP